MLTLFAPEYHDHIFKFLFTFAFSANTAIFGLFIWEILFKYKCESKYRASSEKTKKLIKARLAEGFTEEDFRTVINKKYDEWHGNEFEKYLRPETLFGSKFEGYLNQKNNLPSKTGTQNKFNNFEQRKYNYDEIERELINVSYQSK